VSAADDAERLLEARLDKARRFYRSARAMQRQSDYDNAMSRYYYAAFHSMKAALVRYGVRAGMQQSTHEAVLREFVVLAQRSSWIGNIPVPQARRDIRRTLKWLHDRREDADYEAGSQITAKEAEEAGSFVNNLLQQVERILK